MDFLLILLAVGGFVFAIIMLVLASRARKMQGESDARVEALQMMATGSVLFAAEGPTESAGEPLIFEEPFSPIERGPLAPSPVAARLQPVDPNVDLALYELLDEDSQGRPAVSPEPRAKVEPVDYEIPAPAFPFVITVPAEAGAGRVLVSFDRSRRRRQP